MKLHVPRRPCPTCPYRVDCPSGVWDRTEYEKLPRYDRNETFATFLCHQTTATGEQTVCRGWLTVHAESVAARMGVLNGEFTDDERYADREQSCGRPGRRRATLVRDIDAPSEAAVAKVESLTRRGIGVDDRSDLAVRRRAPRGGT